MMFARARTAVAMAAALALLGGSWPAHGTPGPGEEPPGRTLEEALAADLGMGMAEFAAAGAAAEQGAERLGLDEAVGSADEVPPVARLTATGLEVVGGATDPTHAGFADLEELRDRYLAEVGPEGLTGLAYTLEGYEVLVTDPDVVRERGRTETGGPLLSPAAWAREQAGVSAVGTTEPAVGASLRGGSSISFGSVACTHGFNGFYQGSQVGLSAGHCAWSGGTAVYAGSTRVGTVTWWQFGAPGSAWESYGTDLATFSQGSAYTYPASVTTGSSTVTMTGRAPAVLGMPVCKMGRQTGWTCSTVNKVGWQWIGDGSGDITRPKRWVWSLFADLRVIPGDSGGPWISGHKAVGVTSSYDWYSDGSPYATAALLTSLDEFRPGAQVKVWLGTPTPAGVESVDTTRARARWEQGQTVSGTLSKLSGDLISPGTVVDVVVDGARVTSPAVASSGAFSFTYPGSDSTDHTVVLRPRHGDSRGTSFTVLDEPAGTAPKVVRHAGDDRYGTAATISTTHFSPGVDTVYVASGQAFPDALSGGARAGADGMPVLLTKSGVLPTPTRQALATLAPRRIVVLGGTTAVTDDVVDDLRAYAPTVERIEGEDRYALSAAVARTYGANPSKVFVVSGQAFPDALSASARAGALGVPLLLTKATSTPSVVLAELDRLDPAEIVVVGGTAAVSSDVATALAAYAPKVTRVGGENRYAVSAALARQVPLPVGEAWLATGFDYPDALAAGPVAAKNGSPVVLTRPDALSSAAGAALERIEAPTVRIAGGTVSVSSDVARDVRWLTYTAD